MKQLSSKRLPVLASLAALLVGCSEGGASGTDPPPGEKGTVVAGLDSELRPKVDLHRIHVVQRVEGEVIGDAVVKGDELVFPREYRFEDLDAGALAEIAVEGFNDFKEGVLISRVASTRAVAKRSVLLRVPLETECAISSLPGGAGFHGCDAGVTCIDGTCNDGFTDPEKLEDYEPTWPEGAPDICKPVDAGEPQVVVGEGQADYLPAEDGALAQIEAGPQGGHHIWVAVRMKNLHRSGSFTTVRGYVPDLDLELHAFKWIFTFDQDEGGWCKLYGLRFQLDLDGVKIGDLFGRTVEVTVEVEDKTGDEGVGTRVFKLSDDTI